ncbi:MAG: hypothetical protein OEZ59_04670 [Deltaproteobacteria bacterium]|nr:hypothetical protein [Deltaproteobacteria bacterium]
MLDRFQQWLDEVNRKYGGIGSFLSVLFWIILLLLAIEHMLLDF